MRRLLIWVASVGVGLALLYLVGMNVLLRTRLLRNIMSASPEDMTVEYDSAYSIVPGRVHVEGLRLRGSDSHVQWILGLDRCDFHFWPLDAARRRFHAGHIRGDGVSFRLRLKLDPAEATHDVARTLPPVPGFSDPPYLHFPLPPPPTDANYHLVSIQLDDVVAEHVHEVWVQSARLTGDMTVRGRWLFRPLRWLDVGPATVDAAELRLARGPDLVLLDGLHGQVTATIHPFDVRLMDGLNIFEHISLATSLDGVIELPAIASLSKGAANVTVDAKPPPIEARLDVDRGHVRPGSRLSTSIDVGSFAWQDLGLRSRAEVDVDVEPNGLARAHVDVIGPHVTRKGDELAHASSVSMAILGIGADLAHPSLEGATYKAELHGARADNLVPVHDFVFAKTGVDVEARVLEADGDLAGRVDDHDAHGTVRLSAKSLVLARALDRVEAKPTVTLSIRGASLHERAADLSGSEVTLRDVVAKVHGINGTAQTFSVRVRDGDMSARRVVAHVRDAEATLRTLVVTGGIGALRMLEVPWVAVRAHDVETSAEGTRGLRGALSLDLPQAIVPDLPTLARVAALPDALRILSGRAVVTAHGQLDLASVTVNGDVRATTKALHLIIGTQAFTTDFAAAVVLRPNKTRPAITDLSGSTLTATSDAEKGEEGWWARAAVPTAFVGVREGPTLVATVHLEAKDATPAEALLAQMSGVPRWLIELAPMDRLTASASVVASRSSLEMRAVEARGGPTWLRAEYARRGDAELGGALVHAGDADVGINLGGGGPRFVLFGAELWYQHKVGSLVGPAQAPRTALR